MPYPVRNILLSPHSAGETKMHKITSPLLRKTPTGYGGSQAHQPSWYNP